MKINLKKYLTALVFFALAFNITGCGPTKILMDTYTPPYKQKQVKKMLDTTDSESGYLDLEIVQKISGIQNSTLNKKLLSSLEKFIKQTEFIMIKENITDSTEGLALHMKVLILEYKQTANRINGVVSVEFNIAKDSNRFYTQNYRYNINRYSKAGTQGLPTKGEILAQASDYLAKKLIKDISPIATQKMVSLKSLPSELEYTISYAKGGNYEGAVKGMLKYKGEKTAEYNFNLAVYYEALASKTDSLELLTKADEFYELAMELSQGKDEEIVAGKSKFDNYYGIVKKVAEQKLKNAKSNTNENFELL